MFDAYNPETFAARATSIPAEIREKVIDLAEEFLSTDEYETAEDQIAAARDALRDGECLAKCGASDDVINSAYGGLIDPLLDAVEDDAPAIPADEIRSLLEKLAA